MKTTFYQFLNEAKLTTDFTYYHGCSKSVYGEKILNDGFLKPGNENNKRGHKLTPDIGRTYATPNFRESVVYTMGGDYFPCNNWSSYMERERGKYGYLFEIDRNSFTDVIPDEDYVGQLVHYGNNILNNDLKWLEYAEKDAIKNFYEKWDTYKIKCFLHNCQSILTPLQYKKCLKYDDYADFAVAGKKLNKFLDNQWKKEIIELGTPVGNQGKLTFSKAWKIDKENALRLKKDASNFFDLAVKIL